MQQPNSLLKQFTVANSVVLVAVFLCYHAGCSSLNESRDSEPGTNAPAAGTSQQQPSKNTDSSRTIMSGSKAFDPGQMIKGFTPVTQGNSDAQPSEPSP